MGLDSFAGDCELLLKRDWDVIAIGLPASERFLLSDNLHFLKIILDGVLLLKLRKVLIS